MDNDKTIKLTYPKEVDALFGSRYDEYIPTPEEAKKITEILGSEKMLLKDKKYGTIILLGTGGIGYDLEKMRNPCIFKVPDKLYLTARSSKGIDFTKWVPDWDPLGTVIQTEKKQRKLRKRRYFHKLKMLGGRFFYTPKKNQ